MLIRAFIKYFRQRISKLHLYVPDITPLEEDVLYELISAKNYVPHRGQKVFGSFNTEFKEYLFEMPSFCILFRLYHRNY